MDNLIQKTKIYFEFDNEYIIKYINKFNTTDRNNNNLFQYYYKILLNRIYEYIFFYFTFNERLELYKHSSLYNKVNNTLYKVLFEDDILLLKNLNKKLIKEKLKIYIEEIIFSRIFINKIIDDFENETNKFNIEKYIKKIEKEYFNRQEPIYSKYRQEIIRFENIL